VLVLLISLLDQVLHGLSKRRFKPLINSKDDYFGWSVSISGDGNTAIVGAYYEDTGGQLMLVLLISLLDLVQLGLNKRRFKRVIKKQ
jgi:hypothetical protein